MLDVKCVEYVSYKKYKKGNVKGEVGGLAIFNSYENENGVLDT